MMVALHFSRYVFYVWEGILRRHRQGSMRTADRLRATNEMSRVPSCQKRARNRVSGGRAILSLCGNDGDAWQFWRIKKWPP